MILVVYIGYWGSKPFCKSDLETTLDKNCDKMADAIVGDMPTDIYQIWEWKFSELANDIPDASISTHYYLANEDNGLFQYMYWSYFVKIASNLNSKLDGIA